MINMRSGRGPSTEVNPFYWVVVGVNSLLDTFQFFHANSHSEYEHKGRKKACPSVCVIRVIFCVAVQN